MDPTDKDIKLYLIQPHPAQVVSIMRILGVGYKKEQGGFLSSVKQGWKDVFGDEDERVINDNLVQIKTGEGKSVTLAVVSMVFALHGFNVRCACYSKYLSERDFKSFAKMFEVLGLTDSISYGTFNEICEQ
jgi:SecA DEAD-like domain